MSTEKDPSDFMGFIEGVTTKLRKMAGDQKAFGPMGESIGATLAEAATILESDAQAWHLKMLPISEAAASSGYSEEALREMCRAGKVPHDQGEGANGHYRIARRDLPRKPGTSVQTESVSLADVRASKLLAA